MSEPVYMVRNRRYVRRAIVLLALECFALLLNLPGVALFVLVVLVCTAGFAIAAGREDRI